MPPSPTRHRGDRWLERLYRDLRLRYDRTLYKLRHRVENLFQRLKCFRRIATRYDKLAATFFRWCTSPRLTWV
jgi:transposase